MTQRSARTVFTLVTVLAISASSAGAQTAQPLEKAPGIWKVAVASIEADARESAGTAGHRLRAAESQSAQAFRTNRHSGAQKAMGAIIGVVGGFFAGGLIGASLDRHCGCDDPGLNGFIIGAPIGAIAGGVLGFVVAGR